VPKDRDERRRAEAPAGEPAEDLCATCRSAELCVYCSADREAVLSCVGYRAGASARSVRRTPAGSACAAADELVGLCVNCTLRDDCELDRPASGVWHCPDYC
jgi:hypothetical protein